MNTKDITTLIDKYGPKIADALHTTADKVYPKLLWYIQIDGVRNLISDSLILVIWLFASYKTFTFTRSKASEDYYGGEIYYLFWVIGIVFLFVFLCLVVYSLSMNIMKIIAPEFWIINQIINKTTQ